MHEDLAASGGTGKYCFYKAQENIVTDNICSYQTEIKILGYIINLSGKAQTEIKEETSAKDLPSEMFLAQPATISKRHALTYHEMYNQFDTIFLTHQMYTDKKTIQDKSLQSNYDKAQFLHLLKMTQTFVSTQHSDNLGDKGHKILESLT